MANEGGLDKQRYYHGLLPREDIPVLLKKPGDFLVRMSEPTQGDAQGRQYIISVMWTDDKTGEHDIKHFIVRRKDGMFSIDWFKFDTIPKLVNHHLRKGDSITRNYVCIIRRPVERQPWELDHDHIILTKKIGEGAFGEVHLGILRRPHREEIKCAIKQAKLESMNKDQIKEFMTEARLMRHFECDYIVRLYGVAATEPLSIVMELASEGTLNDYIRKNPNLDEMARIVVCMQASWGIEYLHSKNIIHRDIAARNCLYGNGMVKMADFGMSREGPAYTIPPKKRAPIRWLAPETLRHRTFTFKTDVFTYGILCWEVFHNCSKEPYMPMTTNEVSNYVKAGNRPAIEVQLNPDVHNMITVECWASDPEKRWTIAQVSRALESISGQPRPDFEGESRKRREQEAAEEAAAAAASPAASTPQLEQQAAITSHTINKTQMSVNSMDAGRIAPTPPANEPPQHQLQHQLQMPSSEPAPSREGIDDDDNNNNNNHHPMAGRANTGKENKYSQGSKRKSTPAGAPPSVKKRSRKSRGGDRGRKQPESY